MVILIAGETQIPPIGTPCRDKDGTGYGILGLYLWLKCRYFTVDLYRFQMKLLIEAILLENHTPHMELISLCIIYMERFQTVAQWFYEILCVKFILPVGL